MHAVETMVLEERLDNELLDGTYEIFSDGSLCAIADMSYDTNGGNINKHDIKCNKPIITTINGDKPNADL